MRGDDGCEVIRMKKQIVAAAMCAGMLLGAAGAQTAKPKTKLTLTDARKIALARQAGTIKEGELEHEKGRWIYSFDILRAGKTHEVNVDANTGEIVEDSVESAASEAREAAADAKSK